MQTGHVVTKRPIMNNMQILDQEPSNMHRKIKEAIHIKLNQAKQYFYYLNTYNNILSFLVNYSFFKLFFHATVF